MGEQKAFFPSAFEVFEQNNPERFAPKRGPRPAGSSNPRRSGKKVDATPKVYDCAECGLCNSCRSPRIKRYGEGQKKILFIGLCPGKDEDQIGLPFVGPSGELLRRHCSYVGLDLDKDCVRTNIARCYSTKDPTAVQILCCRQNLLKDIEEVKPELIICLGDLAINAVLEKPKGIKSKTFSRFSAAMMHGMVVYSRKFNCWVASSYHPAFFLRRKNRTDVPDDENLFVFDIARALNYLDKKPIEPLTEDGNVMLSNPDGAIRIINQMCESVDPVGYDYETFQLTPFQPEAELLSIAFTNKVESGYFIPFGLINPATGQKYFNLVEQGFILEAWKRFLASKAPKVVQNLNMEELWNREYLHQSMSNFIHDTMLAQHILHCNTNTTSLAFQVFEMCGHDYKEMVNTKDLRGEDPLKIFHYNCWDARYTLMSYYQQMPRLKREGRLSEFNDLLQKGEMVLVEMRRRGVLIDINVLKSLEDEYDQEREQRFVGMQNSPGVVQYVNDNKDTKGFKGFNPKSTSQMGRILYGVYQVPLYRKTKTQKGKSDVDALEEIQKKTDNQNVKTLIDDLFRYRKCGSLLTRAANYRRLMDVACLVHPIFNLHIADTYRSSADSPNIQNVFKHDKELKKFRRIIIPTPGNILLEADYSGLEVRVIAMASKDEELTRQIIQGVDTHKRWASEIYRKPLGQISSDERFECKNSFIFASFYGATADSIARKFPSAPEGHIAFVQDKFWNEFYSVRTWQRRTIEQYRDCGYVEGMSGFRRYGPLTINKLYNTPIQGPAFHLMVGALIQIEIAFAERGLRSRPIFEIHDSVTIDTVPSEAEEVVKIVTEIMIAKRFEWQGIVPLGVEFEIGITNWYDLTHLEFGDCEFCHVHGPMGHSKDKKDLPDGHKQITHLLQCGTCRQVKQRVEVK